MNLNQLIVCEARPFWTIRIRQLLDEKETQIRESRSLPQCRSMLRVTNSCLAIVEVREDNLADVWIWTHQLTSEFGHPQVAIVGERKMNR